MTTAAVVMLGALALASLAQGVFLVMIALEGRRLARRIDALGARAGGGLKPLLGDLTRATENLAAASAVTVGQARRIDTLMADVASGIAGAQGTLRDVVLPAAARVVSLTAAVRAVRRGLSLYRRVRGHRTR